MTGTQNRNEKRFPVRTALIISLTGISFFLSILFLTSPATSQKFYETTQDSVALAEDTGPKIERFDFKLTGNNTFYQIMSALNVPGPEILDIVKKAKPVFDLTRMKEDSVLKAFTIDGRLQKVEYKFSDYEFLIVERDPDGNMAAKKGELPHEIRETVVTGTIENSLYEDALKAGADPQAVVALTDIFAWDIDFASDIHKGDSFRILSEMLYVDGVPVKTGRLLGAEMENGGKNYTAIYYEGNNGKGYYDEKGRSLKKTLLKSPLRFRRITSTFSRGRFHPVLKRYRPHHGIDYGAPTGTPIESAGSGVVKYAGWKGGYGKYIEIKHSNGYTTAYGHLSRIGKGVRSGSKVDQGQVIGYVGSTGISTGPHLHYEVKVNNKLINPLSVKSLPGVPVPKKELSQFAAVRESVLDKLISGGTAFALNKKD
ncbi:MAG: peptidoglycan DD-metalloendopeptidase family protein [Deltaproteobacteria bacterium]|nr:peptidoglycan DD-metalloendopeptidase family protein [Deltaproteobacteria bacterium]